MNSNKVIIIAEAGVNHNGNVELAKQMIDIAADSGADYVKFQTFISEKVISKHAQMAEYQKNNTGKSESQLEMVKRLELSHEEHHLLIQHCALKGINFLSTAFDLESIDFLNKLNIALFKIPSGEITNYPYLEKIGSLGKPIIISTGMATMEDIENAINVVTKNGASINDITILHCNTEYPTPMHDVNLKAMQTIAERFKVPIGYSDHTLGIEVPTAAVALGATVIEKHFTLDKTLKGPDHKASLGPIELKNMVSAIRNIEKALGNGTKEPTQSELKNKDIARKSIVASKTISKGSLLTEENITTKRPGNGISAMQWPNIIGTIAKKDYLEDDLI
ncbi:N-acetylneuraminate synthase [Winogradskyella sp. UBA3174]|uniref:N-acetylneuraminate synthase n=1 Tax=Winogradskyella sp. UBA3174 TaxID=1947785 RepID=UPI0025DE54A7|nr:N-acetylneuraminate synthase [Winogradskyella sp. UBA3174]|tara:strand:+ start:27098 stop:28102 length:1005 start_codon:yes stop_codon:yes gene_type:complete